MDDTRQLVIDAAEEQGTALWTRVANDLAKASRRRRSVNLSRIARNTKPGETVIIPGKVLGDGDINHQLTIVAHTFSTQAREKLLRAQCEVLTIQEFLAKNPKGTGRIIG